VNKKKFDTGLIGHIADRGKKLNSDKQIDSTDINNKIDSRNNTEVKINNNTNNTDNISTNTSTNIKEKKKYPKKQEKEKLQRAYYFERDILKEFEAFCKRNKADKSEVMSFALREFLDTYE
jgi:hypothetical protein